MARIERYDLVIDGKEYSVQDMDVELTELETHPNTNEFDVPMKAAVTVDGAVLKHDPQAADTDATDYATRDALQQTNDELDALRARVDALEERLDSV